MGMRAAPQRSELRAARMELAAMQEEVAQARQARAELAQLQALRKQARPGLLPCCTRCVCCRSRPLLMRGYDPYVRRACELRCCYRHGRWTVVSMSRYILHTCEEQALLEPVSDVHAILRPWRYALACLAATQRAVLCCCSGGGGTGRGTGRQSKLAHSAGGSHVCLPPCAEHSTDAAD